MFNFDRVIIRSIAWELKSQFNECLMKKCPAQGVNKIGVSAACTITFEIKTESCK